MTRTDADLSRELAAWLDEGPGPDDLPGVVFDAVMERVPTVRQRRGPWPFSVLRSVPAVYAGVAAGIAAIAIWAAMGLPGTDFTGFGPEPTSSADAEQAVVRSTLPFWAGRTPPAGDYVLDEPFPVRIGMTLPDGLEVYSAGGNFGGLCVGECGSDLVGLEFWVVEHGFEDPCLVSAGYLAGGIGPSVDEFVDYLSAQERLEVRATRDVTVDGYDGTYLEVAADADLSDCDSGVLRLFAADNGAGVAHRPASEGDVDRIHVLDVDGTRVVIDLYSEADTPADEVELLQAVIDSLDIGPHAP
jgi:hypothetical protein